MVFSSYARILTEEGQVVINDVTNRLCIGRVLRVPFSEFIPTPEYRPVAGYASTCRSLIGAAACTIQLEEGEVFATGVTVYDYKDYTMYNRYYNNQNGTDLYVTLNRAIPTRCARNASKNTLLILTPYERSDYRERAGRILGYDKYVSDAYALIVTLTTKHSTERAGVQFFNEKGETVFHSSDIYPEMLATWAARVSWRKTSNWLEDFSASSVYDLIEGQEITPHPLEKLKPAAYRPTTLAEQQAVGSAIAKEYEVLPLIAPGSKRAARILKSIHSGRILCSVSCAPFLSVDPRWRYCARFAYPDTGAPFPTLVDVKGHWDGRGKAVIDEFSRARMTEFYYPTNEAAGLVFDVTTAIENKPHQTVGAIK